MGKFQQFELPGEDLVLKGLADLAEQNETIESVLLQIGGPRLRRLNLKIPEFEGGFPEQRLYELLSREDEDSSHARMNALVRRLVSFERALEMVTGPVDHAPIVNNFVKY